LSYIKIILPTYELDLCSFLKHYIQETKIVNNCYSSSSTKLLMINWCFLQIERLNQSYIRVVTAVQCVLQKMATQKLSGAKGVVKAVE